MGTPFQATNPWLGASQVGDALGNTIAQTAIGLPRARLEADMMRAQMQRQQIESQIAQQQAPLHSALLSAQAQAEQAMALSRLQEGSHWDAQAGLAKQQTADLKSQQQSQFELGQLGANFVKESLQNNGHVSPETAAAFAGSLARAHKIDPNLMESMIRTMAASTSGIGGTNQALNNAVASGTKVPVGVNVPPGNTFVNPSAPSVNPFISPVPSAATAGAQDIGNFAGSLLKAGELGGPLYLGGTNTPASRLDFLIQSGQRMREGLTPQIGQPQSSQIPTVTNKAQFDALPSGTVYQGTNGMKYKKP